MPDPIGTVTLDECLRVMRVIYAPLKSAGEDCVTMLTHTLHTAIEGRAIENSNDDGIARGFTYPLTPDVDAPSLALDRVVLLDALYVAESEALNPMPPLSRG